MTATVLEFWLSSLDMRGYHQAFIDNGYDDLEICKKVRLMMMMMMIMTRCNW